MAIIGSRSDSLPVWVVERMVSLARAVGRVAIGGGRFGTGFLVAPQFIMTCNHVIADRETTGECAIEFDYRDDATGTFEALTRVPFDPVPVFASAELDCALLRLREPVSNREVIPLEGGVDVASGQSIIVIHHPYAGPQQIAFRNGLIFNVTDTRFAHTASTLPGSAGAPVFDDGLRLIGIHHAASRISGIEFEGRALTIINEAISVDAIARALRKSGAEWMPEEWSRSETIHVPATSRRDPPAVGGPAAAPPSATEVADATLVQKRSSVFICYARQDQPEGEWRERLRTFLNAFKQELDVWDDSRIRAGAEWKPEIDLALKRARVAVLLVGPNFLASDFIASDELPPLLDGVKRDAVRILPLITNECSYTRTPLGRFQAFHDPDEPLESMDKPRQNRILRQFAEAIYDAMAARESSR